MVGDEAPVRTDRSGGRRGRSGLPVFLWGRFPLLVPSGTLSRLGYHDRWSRDGYGGWLDWDCRPVRGHAVQRPWTASERRGAGESPATGFSFWVRFPLGSYRRRHLDRVGRVVGPATGSRERCPAADGPQSVVG